MPSLIALSLTSILLQPWTPPQRPTTTSKAPAASEPAPIELSPREARPQADAEPEPEPAVPAPEPEPERPVAEPAPTSDVPPPATEPSALSPTTATETSSCPCDELDWACRQNDVEHCPSEAYTLAPAESPSTVSALDHERPPASESSEPSDASSDPLERWDSQGVMLSVGAGVGGCSQLFCVANPLAFAGRGALGYRWPRVGVVATVMGGVGPRTDLPGVLRMLGFDFGVEVFPTGPGRVEPYVGAALGYSRVTETSVLSDPDQTESDLRVYTSRGAFRMSAGLPFRVSPRASVGPRFDYSRTFGGELCAADNTVSECNPIRDIDDQIFESGDPISLRAVRRSFLPHPWAATLELRLVF